MKNTTEKQKRLRVRVVWRDAVSHAEWLNPEDAKKYKPYLNITEGFLSFGAIEANSLQLPLSIWKDDLKFDPQESTK